MKDEEVKAVAGVLADPEALVDLRKQYARLILQKPPCQRTGFHCYELVELTPGEKRLCIFCKEPEK